MLSQRAFFLVVGVVFLAVAALHAVRAFFEWQLILGDYVLPIWLSWLAVLATLFLAYHAFTYLK